jgi:heme oxygenase (mycobilin-producing)
MSVVKINAITVPQDSGDELARRFASRTGAVQDQDGYEGFELLRPADERTTWLVITRWRDEESFQAWLGSADFARAHQGPGAGTDAPGGGSGSAEASGHGGHGGHGAGNRAPVGLSSELWSFTPA